MTTLLSDAYQPPSVSRDDPGRGRRGLSSLGSAPSPWRGGLAAARRHTVLVRVLRSAALAICFLAAGIVLINALLSPSRRLLSELSAGRVSFDGTRITLESPKISGFQLDRRPYALQARVGVQDLSKPQIIELLDIDVGLGTADDKTMQVKASRAQYDSQNEQVLLDGDVRITSVNGYDLSMQSAQVDFKAGTLVSEAPVSLQLDGATIGGERMMIDDRRHVISFDGGVRSLIQPATTPESGHPAPAASPVP